MAFSSACSKSLSTSLRLMRRARRRWMRRIRVARLTAPPPQREPGRMLQGEPADVVKELVRLLYEDARVLEVDAREAGR
jgi:hypothetical protein